MCGIAGIFRLDPRERIDPGLLEEMTDVLSHRGPDDSGLYLDGRIGLGHRRLAIIDLVTGHQPMLNREGAICLVANGEIYNYKELQRELEALGHTFRTKSDSEAIIHSYEQWGTNCVKRFNGMFSFALWDKHRGRLFLARDRLGIKPLYTTVVDGTLLFASEIKSLLLHPGVKREADPESLSSYLGYRCVLGDKTLFKNIEKLTPGHTLVAENGYITKINYWDIPLPTERRDRGEAYYIRKVRTMLRRAVKRRLVSDVPLGAYLSGGLDSSIVVALMAQLGKKPVKTYTVGFHEENFNERPYARLVAERYGTIHTEIMIENEDFTDLIPKLIRFKDAPLAVANEVPLYMMSRELKKDITVVLSGEGADELFGGYGRIFRSPIDYERARFLEDHEELMPGCRDILLNKLTDMYGVSRFLNELDHFTRRYYWLSLIDKEAILSPQMLAKTNGDSRIIEYFKAQFDNARGLSHYEKILYIFQKTHLENLLMRVDTTTMATSVEARVPFVDHELIEYVFSIPFHYKVRWKSRMHEIMAGILTSDEISENFDIPKYILKKSFLDDLPPEVVERKKMGFPVPLNMWRKGRYMDSVKEILLDKRTASRGLLNVSTLEKWLKNDRIEEHSFALKVWMLMNLELWFREYIDNWEGGKGSTPTERLKPKSAPSESVAI